MEDEDNIVNVEVDLRPHDVYTPFRWDRGNLTRWVTAFILCVIFYDLYRRRAALLAFPDGKSILAVVVLLMVFIICALLLFPYLRVRAMFRKSPALTETRRYTFATDGIKIQSDVANSDCKWSLFQRVVETPAVFVLFITTHGAMYVPKRSLSSREDVGRLRKLIRENVSRKLQLRSD